MSEDLTREQIDEGYMAAPVQIRTNMVIAAVNNIRRGRNDELTQYLSERINEVINDSDTSATAFMALCIVLEAELRPLSIPARKAAQSMLETICFQYPEGA